MHRHRSPLLLLSPSARFALLYLLLLLFLLPAGWGQLARLAATILFHPD
ncbi:hypothetical protein WKE96_04955 [Edwardsiella tarda]